VIFIGSALASDGLQNPRFGALSAASNPLIHLSFAEAVDSSKRLYQAGGKVNRVSEAGHQVSSTRNLASDT